MFGCISLLRLKQKRRTEKDNKFILDITEIFVSLLFKYYSTSSVISHVKRTP